MALNIGRALDNQASCRVKRNSVLIRTSRVAPLRQHPALEQCSHAGIIMRMQRASLRTRATDSSTASATAAAEEGTSSEGIHEVEELRGIRANLDGQDPVVEYRVHWKDGSPDTWELASNLSPDLIRDFDERWWQAAKKGDIDALSSMLSYGRNILSQVVDENRRSALHFVAAIGSVKCVKLLADAGADLNLQDKEGYTPLHMACGYMQTGAMSVLLEAGADPLLKDKAGRDVVLLVDNLRRSMPPSMAALQRIMALEQVAGGLTDRLYEEVEPDRILDERAAAGGDGREFLVQYKDDVPDEWVPESLIAADLLADWAAGLERAPVASLLDVQQWGTTREYLVQWADGSPDSWESEDYIPIELVEELQQQQPQLLKGLKMAGKKKKKKSKAGKKQEPQPQPIPAGMQELQTSSSSNGVHSSGNHTLDASTSSSNHVAGASQQDTSSSRERATVSAG